MTKVPQILGTSVRSGDAAFSWNSNGENTIGVTQTYLWKLLDWLSQRQTADKSSIERAHEEFPHYARHPEQVFAFVHREAWADFDRAEFEAYIARLTRSIHEWAGLKGPGTFFSVSAWAAVARCRAMAG